MALQKIDYPIYMKFTVNYRKTIFILIFFQTILFFACSTKNRWEINEKQLSFPKIKVWRYDSVLFNANPLKLQEAVKNIAADYAFFIGNHYEDTFAIKQLQAYITDPLLLEIYNDCQKQFPNLNELSTQLSKAFAYYKYHYPKGNIPKVYSYISGLEYEAPVKYADTVLAISIDMYLGANYKHYKKVGMPLFRQQRCQKEFIIADCIREMAKYHIPEYPKTKFIDQIIYEGKILYLMDAFLPDVPDSIKIGYTAQQLEWCKASEDDMWKYFIHEKILYNNEPFVINKFIVDGPFTQPFTQKSPPRTGAWVGWQIVRKFMNKNKDVNLQQMLAINNAQRILSQSKYNP